ncbi:thioredoxin domain-containing protein [Vagococcus intermedius]|uniref:DsbA family protein n=1 Tax=Vagococcus intermedius TaxID=2991418 RepID=A0AAF0CWM0_9ENTE|nr:thioredoxin domain-containing protein [Vagococcus intermedius]WEG74062.1 DsbA family protein [Vagococcus intermedius]WEG76142.1 DsbA family protein [Vagococcus intermedius]
MDTSQMKAEFLKTSTGIQVGDSNAPVQLIELINVRCPFCRQWFEETNDLLMTYVTDGKLCRTIKLFDKEKPGLKPGNVMHRYISKQDGLLAITQLNSIYETQDEWGNLADLTDIAEFAEERLALSEDYQPEMVEIITNEATKANIPFIPTMIINDTIFDQKITLEALKTLIEK